MNGVGTLGSCAHNGVVLQYMAFALLLRLRWV